MRLPGSTLAAQYRAAIAAWPFIHDVERAYGLPPFLLIAVGSRETNLDPYYVDHPGDEGHGRGLWQLDDRSWDIPDPFPVELQAGKAAELLRSLLDRYGGDLTSALNAYNSGQPKTQYTTGKDYGPETLERLAYLVANFPDPVSIRPRSIPLHLEVPMSYALTIAAGQSVTVPFPAPQRGPVAQVSVRLMAGSDCKVKWSHINAKGWAGGAQEGTVASGGEIGIPIPEGDPPHTGLQVHNLGKDPVSALVEIIPRLAFADGK